MEDFVKMMKERILNARPRILVDRAKMATEVYRDNPALPAEIKRAKIPEKAIKYQMWNRPQG